MLSVESFSDWLLKELNARNMSQSDLARVAGLGSGTISNIVSGNRKVGQETLDKIARALRLPPEAVFRAAGLLPPNKDLDPWVEQQKEIISKLTGTRRNIAERLLQGLLDEEDQAAKYETAAKRPANAAKSP